jgi:dienelactone hydrolase
VTIHTKRVEYRDGDVELAGILTWDDSGSERRPGILVVHGGAGLDEHAKGRARRMAELGYVAFACDMYGQGVTGNRERTMALLMEFRNDRARLRRRARQGLEVLRAQPLVDVRFAAMGFCFGGMVVLELGRSGEELAGVVSVHGSLDTPSRAEPGAVKARVLVCHGAVDPHVPMAHVNAFTEEMEVAGANWQLNMYGGAVHGFTHETGPYPQGVAYNAQADARSAVAIKNFFDEVLACRSN